MKCPSCQAEINEGKKFCPDCGINLAEYAEKAVAQKAEKAYKVGRDFYDIKDYDGAIIRLSEYISYAANGSQNADAYRCRGGSHWAKKRYDEAIEDFDNALNIEPKSAFAYERRGDCYFNKGQYDKATKDFNIALNIEPESRFAREGLNAIAAKQAAAEAAEDETTAPKKATGDGARLRCLMRNELRKYPQITVHEDNDHVRFTTAKMTALLPNDSSNPDNTYSDGAIYSYWYHVNDSDYFRLYFRPSQQDAKTIGKMKQIVSKIGEGRVVPTRNHNLIKRWEFDGASILKLGDAEATKAIKKMIEELLRWESRAGDAE